MRHCKLSLVYSLYSLKQFYLYGKCGRVCESASVCLTSMFCSCSSLNRLSQKQIEDNNKKNYFISCSKFADALYYKHTIT